MEDSRQQRKHVSCDSMTQSILHVIKRNCGAFDIEPKSILVQKRQKSLKDGDFCVPKGCFKINEEEFLHLKEKLMEESKPWTCPVKKVTSDPYNSLLISLDRSLTYKSVISSLLKSEVPCAKVSKNEIENDTQKWNDSKPVERTVLVHVPDCGDCKTLEQLRGLVLTQHVINLLHANGLKTKLSLLNSDADTQKWQELLNFNFDYVLRREEKCDFENILDRARHSEYRLSHKKSNEEDHSLLHTENTSESDHNTADVKKLDKLVLDAEKYLASTSTDSGVYDKNLGEVHFTEKGGITDTLIQMSHLQTCIEKMDKCDCVLHIVQDKKGFQQQKIDLGLQMLVEGMPKQVHMLYGSVTERKSAATQKLNTEEFYSLRFGQMKEASVMKYGECVKGPGWNKTIENLTVASMKFELLLNVPRNIVKLDLSEGNDFGGGVDNRAGAFVMYNCARLATLFKHFNKAVDDGTYPPLPSLDSIDFSLLREEDEWSLFFHYIFPFHDVVRSTVTELLPSKGIYTKLGTHKICNNLIGLSRSLSSYYSHTHVLVENRPNLLPTMYARLYLLKALHFVMTEGLHLLGVTPATQL